MENPIQLVVFLVLLVTMAAAVGELVSKKKLPSAFALAAALLFCYCLFFFTLLREMIWEFIRVWPG